MNQVLNVKNDADLSYCKFGAERLIELLKALESQIDGVINNENPEYVHKMRVSSRRIRATMPIFGTCFPKKEYKKWFKEIKKITRLLAQARDFDVQIAFIENYQKISTSSKNVGLNVLLKHHKRRREEAQIVVAAGLKGLDTSNALPDMRVFCESILKESAQIPLDSISIRKYASSLILSKIDDFLAMEKFVYEPKSIKKHHEMRIHAKMLRYTLESFSALFEDTLTKEIGTITKFQDILGEMHDCDLWIAYIPNFLNSIKTDFSSKGKTKNYGEIKQGLLTFLNYVKEKRQSSYNQFVELWRINEVNNFFEKFKEKLNADLPKSDEKFKVILSNPNIKIGVLADIHANLYALEAVVKDAEKHGVTFFINAGDLVGFGPSPNDIIKLLLSKNAVSIAGNFDLDVIANKTNSRYEKKVAIEFAKAELSKSSLSYLQSLPKDIKLEIGGKKILVVHGGPDSVKEQISKTTPVKRLRAIAQATEANIIIMGHSHEQFYKEVDTVVFLNPGSVGRPNDKNPQAAYAILTLSPFSIELLRTDYDVSASVDALRRKKLPESFAQMLLAGVSIEAIIDEDKTLNEGVIDNCKEIVEITKNVSKKYWSDSEHFEQVRKLALKIFDELQSIHKMERRERCWLEYAAILHDIGLSKGISSHHKKSLELILNNLQLPLASNDKRIVGSIARYHRKGLPKQTHFNFATIDRVTIKKIIMLSSLLRIADGLDSTHQSVVKDLSAKIGSKKIALECVVNSSPAFEQQDLERKKDLFEKIFKLKLVSKWIQQ